MVLIWLLAGVGCYLVGYLFSSSNSVWGVLGPMLVVLFLGSWLVVAPRVKDAWSRFAWLFLVAVLFIVGYLALAFAACVFVAGVMQATR